jgi:hypothetical protein
LPEWVVLLEEDAAPAALLMVSGAAAAGSAEAAGTVSCSWVVGEEGRADVDDDEEEEEASGSSSTVGMVGAAEGLTTMGQEDWDGASGSATGGFMDGVASSVVGAWGTALLYPARQRALAPPTIGLAETDAAATRAATPRVVRR